FSHTKKERPYVLIGTHALIEDSTLCEGVSLTITDEQHRFGVRHRNVLGQKGGAVHSLVMSATPIPRSLAMFLHAKSRISVIDELPPGRQSVDTFYVGEDKLQRVYSFLREKIKNGNQAYIVCPLIDDEEDTNPLQSASEELEEIRKNLPEISSALLHGKQKPEEKNLIMAEFKSGKIQILVSTTVIEVGVDVPNATVMVIRSAERFGLSQLHQLRGRVGRGSEKSHCILISSHSGKAARERLKKLCDCHDGFELAKFDLKTRGPGEFFGTRQSGFGGELFTDAFSMDMIQNAGEAARIFLETATEKDLIPFIHKTRLN
ncbi:MAG: ATP-dependent DNA helicase RecG, partial [Clostridia bacterium]|nr:ATP-dependent DNA helicase RecG [Clostridia bacterium]